MALATAILLIGVAADARAPRRCGFAPLPARRQPGGVLEARAGALVIRSVEPVSDGDWEQSKAWPTNLELSLGDHKCAFDATVGSAGADAYYDARAQVLLLAGVVSENEGMQLAFIDPATCETKARLNTPYGAQSYTSGRCEMSMAVTDRTVTFKGRWRAFGRGPKSLPDQCQRRPWVIDLDAACIGRWRTGAAPPAGDD